MNNKEKLQNLIINTKVNTINKESKKFTEIKAFDFIIINSVKNNKTDFMFKDFKDLQKTIKSVVKVDNLFKILEILKDKLKKENIDYKSTFFLRVITS